MVGGRSSVDIGEHKSSLRGRGSRHSTQGRGVSWAPDTVDKDFDRNAGMLEELISILGMDSSCAMQSAISEDFEFIFFIRRLSST